MNRHHFFIALVLFNFSRADALLGLATFCSMLLFSILSEVFSGLMTSFWIYRVVCSTKEWLRFCGIRFFLDLIGSFI